MHFSPKQTGLRRPPSCVKNTIYGGLSEKFGKNYMERLPNFTAQSGQIHHFRLFIHVRLFPQQLTRKLANVFIYKNHPQVRCEVSQSSFHHLQYYPFFCQMSSSHPSIFCITYTIQGHRESWSLSHV